MKHYQLTKGKWQETTEPKGQRIALYGKNDTQEAWGYFSNSLAYFDKLITKEGPHFAIFPVDFERQKILLKRRGKEISRLLRPNGTITCEFLEKSVVKWTALRKTGEKESFDYFDEAENFINN